MVSAVIGQIHRASVAQVVMAVVVRKSRAADPSATIQINEVGSMDVIIRLDFRKIIESNGRWCGWRPNGNSNVDIYRNLGPGR